ncbi:MAG TPA: NAD(P)H-quinone oxidoreductase [Thermoanaerobaculia bacterium]|nr:NAD(P)H-quinone oxidoreductase [Thermoanaerobaculia bacterium]
MRAVLPVADPADGVPVPRLGDLPDPVPGVGEVLVAVEAAGLNRADLYQLAGHYPPPAGESAVPGLECCGRIAALGPGVERWQIGARVMALLAGGGQATRVVVASGQLMPMPENLSSIEGAAIPEAGLTAWTNLVAEGHLVAGESVLITGATGGVGSFAAQLARELGARVIAAARDRERLERLRQFGLDELLADGDELADRVRKMTGGRGVDLVLDLVGGARLSSHLAALKTGGRLVLIGLLAGERAELELYPILRRRLRLIGSVLRARSRDEKARLVAGFSNFAVPKLRAGLLRPVVDRVLPLERIAEAYAAMAQGGLFGKVVISMP